MKRTCEQIFLQGAFRLILSLLPTLVGPCNLGYGKRRCIKIKIKGLKKYTAGRLFRTWASKLRKALSLPGEEKTLVESQGQGESEHRRCHLPSANLWESEPPAYRSAWECWGLQGVQGDWGGLKVRCMAFKKADTASQWQVHKWMNMPLERAGLAGLAKDFSPPTPPFLFS